MMKSTGCIHDVNAEDVSKKSSVRNGFGGRSASRHDGSAEYSAGIFGIFGMIVAPKPSPGLGNMRMLGRHHVQTWTLLFGNNITHNCKKVVATTMVVYLDRQRAEHDWASQAQRIIAAARSGHVLQDEAILWRRAWPYLGTALEFAETFLPARAVVCETREGQVGIVPTSAQPDALVVLFQGGKVPFLVREIEGVGTEGRDEGGRLGREEGNRRRMFYLVGECYIHGIMSGQAMREDGWTDKLQEFRLK
jgi:hypothetical protein